jgi:hypothetical protein
VHGLNPLRPAAAAIRAREAIWSLFVWLVADGWCWFVLREKYRWVVVGGWFGLGGKYCWLVCGVPDKPSANRGDDGDDYEGHLRRSSIILFFVKVHTLPKNYTLCSSENG